MIRAAFFLPDLAVGGAEKATLSILRHLDRARVRSVLVLLRRAGRLLDEVPPGIPVVDLGRRRRIHLPLAAGRLGPALREHGIDVLLTQLEVPVLMALAARPLLPRRLLLGMIEQNVPSVYLPTRTPLVPLYKRIYRCHDLTIGVSSVAARDLERHFGCRDVVVIHNPIEIAELVRDGPAPHPWLEDSVPTIVTIGRLVPQKGHDILLRAFELVRAKIRARLLIFGEGPLKFAAGPDVAFAGHLARVGPALRRATLFALSSRVEGFGIVVAEAMACGAPVVATRCGVEEYLRDGDNGLLVPVEDPPALAAAIVRMLESPDLRRRLAERARRDAGAFDAPAVARRYEDVLEQAVLKFRRAHGR